MPTGHSNGKVTAFLRTAMLVGHRRTTSGSLQAAHQHRKSRSGAGWASAWFLALIGTWSCLLNVPRARAEANAKNVLILYGFNDADLYGPVGSLESSLRARVPVPIDFYVESFEDGQLDDEQYQGGIARTLRHVYQNQRLDLVMVASYPALQFALSHRNELFPGVPIVFFYIEIRRIPVQKLWPGVAGVTGIYDLGATIDLMLRLHPASSTIALITSNSKFNDYWLTFVHGILKQSHSNVRVVDLVGLPTDQLSSKVAELPSGTVILFGMNPRQSTHPAVGVWEALARVAQLRPTYCASPVGGCLTHGGIGGAFYDGEEQNLLAAQVAGRVLAGERPEDIPISHGSPDRYYFSWPALQHWHIPESALPPGAVILYREPTFWQRDRKYIVPAFGVILAQALLIIGLLWQRARKRKAEAVLRESEERFRVMADTTPSLIWMCDTQGKVTYLNERWLAFAGPGPIEGYGDSWIANIHPDDVQQVLDGLWEALKNRKPYSTEYRLHRNDGVYRWMFDVASPRINGDGSFAGFIGSSIDVTDQKLAQRALEQVSGQLIEAQEKERTRIARDLHDDICQQLAVLSMELDQAKSVSKGQVLATNNLEEIRRHCSAIAGNVQSLSHQLHSPKLDYLGIVAAIRGFCREFSRQDGIDIEFTDSNVPQHLPKDISLCLFRVAQEALHNAVKYSGVSRFKVELSSSPSEVRLQVTDSGAGFDVEEAKKTRGLGLVSMQERMHLVHGHLSIVSKPREGTTILAVVPIATEKESSLEDNLTRETAGMVGME